MDGWYLKHLLEKLEGESPSIHIVDDNIDSSFRSLPERGAVPRPRPICQRANSLNSVIVVNTKNKDYQVSNVYDYYVDGSRSKNMQNQQLPGNEEMEKNASKSNLSARMERHRQSRWDASPNSSFSGSLHSFGSSHTATTTALHTSFGSLEIYSDDEDENDDLPRDRDATKKTTNTSERDSNRDDPERDRRLVTESAASSHRFLINKAIAISTGDTISDSRKNFRTRTKERNGTISSRRLNVDRPHLNLDATCFPPKVPKRRCSIDDIEIPLSSIVGRPSPILLNDRTSPEFGVPGCLRDLPYFTCDTHSI